MNDASIVLSGSAVPDGDGSVHAFVLVPDAAGFLAFAAEVFDAVEVESARTPTPDGSLIHAETRIGDTRLLLADPQPGWPARPGLFQVWVADLEIVLERATARGSVVVTPPTPFYGQLTLARLEDAWGNLWWLYRPTPGQPDPVPAWAGGSDAVFRTLDEHLRSRGIG